MTEELTTVRDALREFAKRRNWEQFHTPKNLAMALSGEVGELIAELQWLSDHEIVTRLASDGEFRRRVEDELADVMIYLVYLADALRSPLAEIAMRKIERNEHRYPADLSSGLVGELSRVSDVESEKGLSE